MNTAFMVVAVLGSIISVHAQTPCVTPNGEQARCVSIYQCKVFIDALANRTPEVIKFMRESQCGYREDPLVCCGSIVKYQPIVTPSPPPVTQNPLGPISHRNIKLIEREGVCGIQALQDKVFGGKQTGIDEFPWMALLEYRMNGKSSGHSCGGVLINERYVLTAAHCIVGDILIQVGTLYRVRLGEYNLDQETDCVKLSEEEDSDEDCAPPHVDIDVEEAIAHPQYGDKTASRYNDIALVRLSKKVNYSEFIKPICLPIRGEKSGPGQDLNVAGWGYTEKGIFSPIKLKATLPLVAEQQCQNAYNRFSVKLASSQLCAGGLKGIDSCNGDSGGPLMRTYPNRTDYYVEGVVSFGSQFCGTEGLPGIYTRVTEYMDWILDNMKPF